MKEIYYFEKKEGKIYGSFPKLKDGYWKITEAKKTRTLNQNRLYWGYILTFIIQQYRDFGYIHLKDELHKTLKKYLLPRKRIYSDFSKSYVYISGTTTDLNTKQFTEYIEMIKAIFEFGEMEKLGLEKIDSFIIPDITEDELIYWESIIV